MGVQERLFIVKVVKKISLKINKITFHYHRPLIKVVIINYKTRPW